MPKYNLDELVFVKNFKKQKKWIKEKNIKLLESRWVLVDSCDGIMCKRHVNELKLSREVIHEMSEKVEEKGQVDKQYSDYDRCERVDKNRFPGYNEKIKEQFNNENTVEVNLSFCKILYQVQL